MTVTMESLLCVVAMATLTLGCSPPMGGFKEPTPAEQVFYSGHVVVGTVRGRVYPDPFYKDMYKNETYGAEVRVRCTYKGPILGDSITIHGAGVVPGHCTAKELNPGSEVIIFLRKKDAADSTYEQTYTAEKYSSFAIEKYISVCDMAMEYPQENGMGLRRRVCPRVNKQANCQRYQEGAWEPKKPRVLDVDVRLREENNVTMTTEGPIGSSPAITASLLLAVVGSVVVRLV